jgi:hypothetical protein
MPAALRWALVVSIISASCGPPKVDLTKGLQVVDVSTGWLDAGVVDSKNKLVPSVTFRFKNVSDQPLNALQANIVFRRVISDEDWGTAFLRITGAEALAPGETSESHTVNSKLGYTGTESRQAMLENSQFVDAKVEIFAKYGPIQWQRIAEHAISRKLITK